LFVPRDRLRILRQLRRVPSLDRVSIRAYIRRRRVQRRITIDARPWNRGKVSGKFEDSTRAASPSWQDEHGYPKTGFLDVTQHKALLEEGASAIKISENDNLGAGPGKEEVH
jgi:hypothetical protein